MKWRESFYKKNRIFLYEQNWKGATEGRNNLKWRVKGLGLEREGRERRERGSEGGRQREIFSGDGGCATLQLRTQNTRGAMVTHSSNFST